MALFFFVLAGLLSGCCDECETPVSPVKTNPLIGSWECVRYLLDGESQTGMIGMLMTFNSDGKGGVGPPEDPYNQEFAWASLEEKVYVESEELGLATGFNHTISGDTLYMNVSTQIFGGSLMEVEADYIRWSGLVDE